MTTLKPGVRVVDIWFGATGTVVEPHPSPPMAEPTDREPWVLVQWDYMGNEHFWAREADLKPVRLSS